MLAVCIGIFVSGGYVAKKGRYYPFLLIGYVMLYRSRSAQQLTLSRPPIAIVGFALLYTVTEFTSSAKVIGFQILGGFGIGLSFQNILLAVQAEYADRPHLIPQVGPHHLISRGYSDESQATSVISFFQLTGAALGVG